MLTTLRLILAALIWFAPAAAEQVIITVLATTDLHGHLYPVDYYTGEPAERGLAKIATLIRAARQGNPNTLLVDVGDTIQGSPLESVYQQYVATGRLPARLTFSGGPLRQDPMMLAMNHLGYEAMVLGNHEFNFGLKNLNRARGDARFPWISANTAAAPGARPFEPYVVKSAGGVKVAVIGITTPAVPAFEKPENYCGYRFLPPRQAVVAALEELRRKHRPDLVVLGAHAGLGRDSGAGVPGENTIYEVADSVEGIDAIILGHTHQEFSGKRIGSVLLVQPRNWGMSLARLEFTLDRQPGQAWRVTAKSSRLLRVSGQVAADTEILRLAAPYHQLTERYLNTHVAESPAAMDGRLGRIQDTALVDAVHAVQMHYAKADVSFTALFNPRVSFPRGPVTVRQIAALYIYDNELYAIEGTGKMVKDALENAARYYLSCPDAACSHGPLVNRNVAGFNYDMAAGVDYTVDLTRPAGQRIADLRWRAKPLAPEQKLRIAVNNYRAAGSAGYQMFRDAKILWRSSASIRDLIVEYYTRHKSLPLHPDGNWSIIPPQAYQLLRQEALALQ